MVELTRQCISRVSKAFDLISVTVGERNSSETMRAYLLVGAALVDLVDDVLRFGSAFVAAGKM